MARAEQDRQRALERPIKMESPSRGRYNRRAPEPLPEGAMMPRLARLFDEVLRFLWSASPTLATSIGIHDHDHRLIDWDPAAIEDYLRALSAHRESIARSAAQGPPPTP